MKFDNLKINYTTNQVPPPYAHQYSLNIAFNGKNLEVGFELNYIHRDDISPEEITAEGFSENDDFKWNGSLNTVWIKDIKDLLNGIDWNSDKELSEFDQNIHHFELKSESTKREVTLYDHEKVDLVLQEILQAIYETAKIESPLKIDFLKIEGPKRENASFVTSFKNRSVSITKNGKTTDIDWMNGKHFMGQLFQPDYLAPPVKPKKNGLYVSFLENQWYQIDKVETEEGITGLDLKIQEFIQF